MEKSFKFALPSPNFDKSAKDARKSKPHFLTPSGMSLLPREKQPPSMYGKHGATVPPKYLQHHVQKPQFTERVAIPPSTEKQYCDTCDLELHSLNDLKRHRAQHEKCPVGGCVYKGHPSVMDKHINDLHASGLFDKFKKFSTPEEIAACREERRKRYPTVANSLLKQKAQEQRKKRGERLEANRSRFGKVNDRKRAQPIAEDDKNQVEEKRHKKEHTNSQRKRNSKNKRNATKSKLQERNPKVQQEVRQADIGKEDGSEVCCGIKMFRGTSQLKDYKHFSEKKKLVTHNALFGLVGMYGSDDESGSNESDTEDKEEIFEIDNIFEENKNDSDNTDTDKFMKNDPVNSIIENASLIKTNNEIVKETGNENELQTSNNSNIRKCSLPGIACEIINCTSYQDITSNKIEPIKNFSSPNDNSSDEAPDEIPIQRNMIEYPAKSSENILIAIPNKKSDTKVSKQTEQPAKCQQKQKVKRKSGLDYRKARLRKQNTMLEKLLETDIRHERNVLLQCVRYVCENNFFGIGQNNQENPD